MQLNLPQLEWSQVAQSPQPRDAAGQLLKAPLAALWEQERAAILKQEIQGLEAARARASLFRDLLAALSGALAEHHELPASAQPSLVAQGGFGRGELAPFSDLDILILWRQKRQIDRAFTEDLLYILWDLGFKVGYAVRDLGECLAEARRDHTILTSLLETQLIWGNAAPYQELSARISALATRHRRRFLTNKLEERDARHQRTGDSRYTLEPNVKEGKGGLRDLQSLGWIARAVFGDASTQALQRAGVLNAEQAEQLERSADFLWNLRLVLHALSNRAEDRLSFELQPEVARVLGYEGQALDDMKGQAEAFMKDFYRVTKNVGLLTRVLLAALEEQEIRPLSAYLTPSLRQRMTPEGYRIDKGRLGLADPETFKREPLHLLRFFNAAYRLGVDVKPQALNLASQAASQINETLCQDPEANRLFLEILDGRADPVPVLTLMSDSGILGTFLPDWGRVVGLMQFDRYHHFTVDEHTLFVLHHLHAIAMGQAEKTLAWGTPIFEKVEKPHLLYLAALLHDLAKGRGGDHSELGADMARELGPRLGLNHAETELLAWLILDHLTMSKAAFRRDLEDPETLRAFSERVDTPQRLYMLTLLTMADVRGVGPNVWTDWSAMLMSKLYERSAQLLEQGAQTAARPERLETSYSDYEEAIDDLPAEWRAMHRARLPQDYVLDYEASAQSFHARQLYAHEGQAWPLIAMERDANSQAVRLLVAAPDDAGLLARLAGAIALYGAEIKGCRIHTFGDGLALDTFTLVSKSDPLTSPSDAKRLRKLLDDAVTRRLEVKGLASRISQRRVPAKADVFREPPSVRFDNRGGPDRPTLMEVRFTSRPGQLFRIAASLANEGVQVQAMKATAYGDRIVDVFYIRDLMGTKLVSAARMQRLEQSICEALR